MSTEEMQFVKDIAEAIPDVRSILREHLEDQYGELLPHVFMGDLTRWVLRLLASAGPRDQRLQAVLGLMERGWGSSDAVRELIGVSFLENLPRPGEAQSEIRNMLRPRLREELDKIG